MALPDRRVRGGPPSHLYLLRDSLIKLGVDVRSMLYGGRTHDEGSLRKVTGRLLDLARLPVQIVRHRPDVVQLNSAFDQKGVLRDIFFVPAARLLGRNVVVKFHGSDLDLLGRRHAIRRAMTWFVVRSAHVVGVLSHEEQEAFRRRFPRSRIVMVKNALDLDRYRVTEDFRAKYAIPADRPLLLFVARFIATKGLREILQALPAVLRQHDVHLACLGDGPVRGQCEALADELGVRHHVTFTGYIPEEETPNAYLAADMLVFPTYHQEGMPMVIFHSLACGLPIITTRIRAAADWLVEPEHCLFVPPRDTESVARAVCRLLNDRDQMRRMAQATKKLAQRFDRTVVAREFLSLYESLCARRSTIMPSVSSEVVGVTEE